MYAGIHETSMGQKDIYIGENLTCVPKNNYQFFYALIMCMFLSANGQDIATALVYFIYLFDKYYL